MKFHKDMKLLSEIDSLETYYELYDEMWVAHDMWRKIESVKYKVGDIVWVYAERLKINRTQPVCIGEVAKINRVSIGVNQYEYDYKATGSSECQFISYERLDPNSIEKATPHEAAKYMLVGKYS